jgi:hypothetical protein
MKLTFSRITMFTAAMLALAASTAFSDILRERNRERVMFRTTTIAAGVMATQPWTAPSGSPFFSDSGVFRKGTTAALTVDTTQAISTQRFKWNDISLTGAVDTGSDTLDTPWIMLMAYPTNVGPTFSGTSALDSIYVSAQVSVDGSTWASAATAPTKQHFVANVSPTTIISLPAIEGAAGAPVLVNLECVGMNVLMTNGLRIDNQLCNYPWVRFIVSVGASQGQFAVDLVSYK